MDTAIRALATAISGFIHIFNPEAVIIGGGIAETGGALFAPLVEEAGKRASSFMWQQVQILPATVGSDSGVIGSAAQVWHYASPK